MMPSNMNSHLQPASPAWALNVLYNAAWRYPLNIVPTLAEFSKSATLFPNSEGPYQLPRMEEKPGKATASKEPMKNRRAYS